MNACVDVHYHEEQSARAALVLFRDWSDAEPADEVCIETGVTDSYRPGEFYRRELAPILEVLGATTRSIETLVIDGYCHLSPDARPGLGAHVHDAAPEIPRVIGVAKSPFHGATHAVEIVRGGSARALFVTSIGIDPVEAARRIAGMQGEHRIPTLIKRADRLARGIAGEGVSWQA